MSEERIRLVCVLLSLVTSSLPLAAHASGSRPPRARVYVFTARSDATSVSDDEQGRMESVQDLIEAVRHRADLIPVPTPGEAQVRVEVVNREARDAASGGFGGRSLTPFRETIVRLLIETADVKGELKGTGRPSWKAAAKDAAERLSKWVASHPVSR